MFAVTTGSEITSFPKGNKGITIGDVNYPASIFTLWTEAERNAIGVYTVIIDSSNKKDEEWYINTDLSYEFSAGKVTGSYGTATARKLSDTTYTEQDKTDGKIPSDKNVGDIATRGLKYLKKEMIDNLCAGLLAPSDWRVVKAQETGEAMDSGWKTWRASVRTKCNSMQTQIDNASDVDALAALFTYTRDSDGVTSRPLGEFPEKD